MLGNGSELRGADKKVIQTYPLDYETCETFENIARKYGVTLICSTGGVDYRIGTEEEMIDSIVEQMKTFAPEATREEVLKHSLFERILSRTKSIQDVKSMKEKNLPIFKVTVFSTDLMLLKNVREELAKMDGIAVAASFQTNIEITAKKAQKGLVLKEYIESLGYTMDEVMVMGDSPNDYSMLSMDYGATVAMEAVMNDNLELLKP